MDVFTVRSHILNIHLYVQNVSATVLLMHIWKTAEFNIRVSYFETDYIYHSCIFIARRHASVYMPYVCLLQFCVLVGWLEFNVPFQYKYGYIRDEFCVLLKRLNVGSRKESHKIAVDSCFLMPKISAKLKRGHPKRRRQMQVGLVKIGDF